jgi:hypothetical protein
MNIYIKNMDVKWQISLFSALIFLLVVHPMTYKLTQKLLGGILGKISDPSGCPTAVGLALHTIVYILLVRGSMESGTFGSP